ncbi:GNAT family N-acetyltransferase [Pseudofrankia asymbiotica]|uniref:GNAT family N-acetyltransferase n=1 Tax=Pseudofrankia asymbiotica TaxID=1834516 RepID=UPI0018E962E8
MAATRAAGSGGPGQSHLGHRRDLDPRDELAVGQAGYHGPPGGRGTVEVGYAVDPRHRRRGYTRAALEALPVRAARKPRVCTIRASIRPDSALSSLLVTQYGLRNVGER